MALSRLSSRLVGQAILPPSPPFSCAQDRVKDYLSRGLRAAAGADQADVVRYLLERGAVINPYLDPLAALRAKSLDTFKLLIEYGWDVKEEGCKILP